MTKASVININNEISSTQENTARRRLSGQYKETVGRFFFVPSIQQVDHSVFRFRRVKTQTEQTTPWLSMDTHNMLLREQ